MNILLPSQFNRDTMYSLISKVIDNNYTPKYSNIEFDFSSLNFIKPAGVTVLSNVIQWLMKRSVHVTIRYPQLSQWDFRKNNPIKYLDDSEFFRHYLGQSLFTQSSLRKTTSPLRHVAFHEYYSWMEFSFIPWLMGQLNLSTRHSLENVKICLQEIFNNISDHSTEKIGCVFAQHYPAYSSVTITASDFGVGIPTRIREREGNIDDATALTLAIKEGYSTKTLPNNTGAGLDTIVSNVVHNNKGEVYIHSNNGVLSYICRQRPCIMSQNCERWYPGTLFQLILNTDCFYNDIEEEDFVW